MKTSTALAVLVVALALASTAAAFSTTFAAPQFNAATKTAVVPVTVTCDPWGAFVSVDELIQQGVVTPVARERGEWRVTDEEFATVPCSGQVSLTFHGFHAGPAHMSANSIEFFDGGWQYGVEQSGYVKLR